MDQSIALTGVRQAD